MYKKAFDALSYYLEANVIQKRQVLFMTEVNSYYQALIHDFGGYEFKDIIPSPQKLLEKIQKQMDGKISTAKCTKGNLLFCSAMTIEDALKSQSNKNKTTGIQAKLRDAAFLLRQAIMEAEIHPLPDNLTIEDIGKGEIDVPDIVQEFLQNVISGPDYRRKTEAKQRRINSIGQDLIFAATAGRKKPRKHLQLQSWTKCLRKSF